jgi:hypothetical protein
MSSGTDIFKPKRQLNSSFSIGWRQTTRGRRKGDATTAIPRHARGGLLFRYRDKNALGTEKKAQVAEQPELIYAVTVRANLGGHDELVLMQSLDLLGLQRDRRIAPTEADIWMMAFSFREFSNLLNKGNASRKLRNRKLLAMR